MIQEREEDPHIHGFEYKSRDGIQRIVTSYTGCDL